MTLYEVINPSDDVTFRAADPKIAIGVTMVVGEGQYPLEDEKSTNYPTMFLSGKKEDADKGLQPYFTSVENMLEYLDAHLQETIDALESFSVVSIAGRVDFEKALEAIDDPEKRKKWREEFEDRHRSSVNNICGYAHKMTNIYKKRQSKVGETGERQP